MPEKIESVPLRAVRHLVSMPVTESLGQGTAGADPTAIGAFPPASDNERDNDESLDTTDDNPSPQWLRGKPVPNHMKP